jgi:hypothetical protein
VDRAGHPASLAGRAASRRAARRWARIPEMDHRTLRVILLEDGETVHNAFFDREFKE